MKTRMHLAVAFLVASHTVHADQLTMLTAFGPPRSSNPSGIVDVNGTLFFGADGGVNGSGLWKSDGTAAGTVLLKDINPSQLVNVNGTLFFSAYDGNPYDLWKSDGTTEGTVLLKAIRDPNTRGLSQVVNVNGTAFFSAYDGNGYGLWKSDGTPAGSFPTRPFMV